MWAVHTTVIIADRREARSELGTALWVTKWHAVIFDHLLRFPTVPTATPCTCWLSHYGRMMSCSCSGGATLCRWNDSQWSIWCHLIHAGSTWMFLPGRRAGFHNFWASRVLSTATGVLDFTRLCAYRLGPSLGGTIRRACLYSPFTGNIKVYIDPLKDI